MTIQFYKVKPEYREWYKENGRNVNTIAERDNVIVQTVLPIYRTTVVDVAGTEQPCTLVTDNVFTALVPDCFLEPVEGESNA